jgi:hypothetical protein
MSWEVLSFDLYTAERIMLFHTGCGVGSTYVRSVTIFAEGHDARIGPG